MAEVFAHRSGGIGKGMLSLFSYHLNTSAFTAYIRRGIIQIHKNQASLC